MNTTNKRKHKRLRKPVKLAISLLLLVCVSVGGTVAYMTSRGTVTNQFSVGTVDTSVVETFEENVKTNVTAKNDGSVPVFIRIKLVSYRENDNGDHIGGTSLVPDFTPGNGWFKSGDCYYYKDIVQPGMNPGATAKDELGIPLIGAQGITLKKYSDSDGPDGGKQVIEVIAEAVQASPAQAVSDAWGKYVDVHVNTSTNEPEYISEKGGK